MARCIMVISTGRDGSSAVAGALHHLGCPMGILEHLLIRARPEQTEPLCYFEDRCWWKLNREVGAQQPTADQCRRYREIIKTHRQEPIWGVKDPALCHTADWAIPLIQETGDEVYMVAVHRAFQSVVASTILHSYPDIYDAEAFQARNCLVFFRTLNSFGGPILHVAYERLLSGRKREVKRLANYAFDGLEAPGAKALERATNFIEPDLCHHGLLGALSNGRRPG